MTETEFVDAGPPLSPAEAGTFEYELERRGIALRLRMCARDGDRQAVQVAPADLAAAMAVRDELFPAAPASEPKGPSRSRKWRNAAIAGVLGLVASARVVRLVRVPKGPTTAFVMVGIALVSFAIAFGLTNEPPDTGP